MAAHHDGGDFADGHEIATQNPGKRILAQMQRLKQRLAIDRQQQHGRQRRRSQAKSSAAIPPAKKHPPPESASAGIKKTGPVALHPVVQGMLQKIAQRGPDQHRRQKTRWSRAVAPRARPIAISTKISGVARPICARQEFDQKAQGEMAGADAAELKDKGLPVMARLPEKVGREDQPAPGRRPDRARASTTSRASAGADSIHASQAACRRPGRAPNISTASPGRQPRRRPATMCPFPLACT